MRWMSSITMIGSMTLLHWLGFPRPSSSRLSADLILDQTHRFQFASRRVPILWILRREIAPELTTAISSGEQYPSLRWLMMCLGRRGRDGRCGTS